MTEWDAAAYARRSGLQEAMIQEVLALLHLGGPGRVLDVGCRDGRITAQIAACVPQGSVVGVDSSHDRIAFASNHSANAASSNLRLEVANAYNLPFHSEFDLVVSFNALHWLTDQDAPLRSIRAAMRPNARARLRWVPSGQRKSLENVLEETRLLPESEKLAFINQVLDRYQPVATDIPSEENTFKFFRWTSLSPVYHAIATLRLSGERSRPQPCCERVGKAPFGGGEFPEGTAPAVLCSSHQHFGFSRYRPHPRPRTRIPIIFLLSASTTAPASRPSVAQSLRRTASAVRSQARGPARASTSGIAHQTQSPLSASMPAH